METTYQEIINFAIEKEIEAANLYEDLGKRVKKEHAKTMFNELREEEVKHRKFLEGLDKGEVPDLPVKQVTDLKISDYLVDVEFKPDMDYQDILIMAMKREESATKLYADMASKIEEPELNKFLRAMSQEEKKHKLRLEKEYDQNILAED
jgi:rubrerythrin